MRQLTICFVAFMCIVSGLAQEASSPVLVVLAGKNWSFQQKDLGRGQTLATDSELTESPGESPDLVLGCGKAGWLSYSCRKIPCTIKACQPKDSNVDAHRVDPDPSAKGPSGGSGGGWFSSLFKREPATLAVLGVREGGNLTDSVVQQKGPEVHLGPSLARVLEGKYCIRFTPLPPGNASLTKTAQIDWDRSTDAEGIVQAPDLKAGLYALEKSDSEAAGACTFQPSPTLTWMLVSPESDYANLASQWKGYTAQMRDMERDGASPTVLLTVRHAALAHLADSNAGSR